MILIPYESIQRANKNESIHAACERIWNTKKHDANGRMVKVTTTVQGKQLELASVYAPAKPMDGDRLSHRPAFFTWLKAHITRRTVMGLDANCVPDPDLDVKSNATTPYDNAGAKELAEIVDENGLIDVARATLGDEPFFSAHHKVNGGHCWSRIDQIYAPDDADTQWNHVECQDFFPAPPARVELDHRAVSASATVETPEPGQDLEHINEKIFDDPTAAQKIAKIITQAEENVDKTSPTGWSDMWERLKKELREVCIKESDKLKYKESKSLKSMKKQLAIIRKRHTKGESTSADIDRENELKTEIRNASKKEYTLHQTLEREAYNIGKSHDNCTKEFFRPWKSTHAAQSIRELKVADWTDPSNPVFEEETAEDGNQQVRKATDTDGVLREITKYYTALFAEKNIDEQAKRACLQTLETGNRVLPPTAKECGADITVDETAEVLADLPTGKSAGPDRLPNRLYKTQSAQLARIMTEVFNESRRNGALPPTCIEGLISVLYKKSDRDDPRHYRPITLLNGDYKVLTRILTRRMNVAVVQFVSRCQNGFVPGGFLPENIMLLKLIQAYIEEEDEDAYFVFLDMEKAFDRSSWVYLREALNAIGLGEDDAPAPTATMHPNPVPGQQPNQAPPAPNCFASFVDLFYSHDHPPTRRISMNGHLGPSFPLNSGVAQGCPLSPLLFLVITEALSRLIENDKGIKGVKIGDEAHKISQYADDSTLIGRDSEDWEKQDGHLRTWCRGTAMSENGAKREGQLLGKLARQRTRAPKNVIKNEAWVKDGDTIRALGVPMGNRVDEEAWFTKKYREVKQRIAAWRSIGHMSITGRNLLLQAILYGSLRFWFFSLVVPEKIIEYLEEDAYHLIWASNPELFSDEDGTEKKSRAYVRKAPSYLDQRKGGAGLMHLRSHIQAFYAQWIRRYLHPSTPPWKAVADIWLAEPYPMGRGSMLCNYAPGTTFTNDIPRAAKYLRKCVAAFEALQLEQDTSTIDATVAGESFFDNHRFEISVSAEASEHWSKYLGLKRIHNLIDEETNDIFTKDQMKEFSYEHAPEHIKDTPAAHEWSDALMSTWDDMIDQLPGEIIDAATEHFDPEVGDTVAFTGPHVQHYYAITEEDENGDKRYQRLWIDTFGTPHPTGTYVSDYQQMVHSKMRVALWIEEMEEDAHYNFDSPDPSAQGEAEWDEEDVGKKVKIHVIGPASLAFPICEGWSPRKNQPDPAYAIETLAHLTIKRMTKLFTLDITKDERPTCETKWPEKIGGAIPFDIIWPSLGTPLSDATEEKQWRKMLHRAINVRNRHPNAPSQLCRMGCGCIERMLHLVECTRLRQYWKLVIDFTVDVLEVERFGITKMIIFNLGRGNQLLPQAACAFIRHAFDVFYRDFTLIETADRNFCAEYAYRDTMISFRTAVLDYGQTIKDFRTTRKYTVQKSKVPQDVIHKFPQLIDFDPDNYSFKLTAEFQAAITTAEAAAEAHRAAQIQHPN